VLSGCGFIFGDAAPALPVVRRRDRKAMPDVADYH
jgi:hypothetical protein